MEQSRQSELIRNALESVKNVIDANTVTGTPITTESGTVIIPISKVFVGIASGGIDYFGRKTTADKNFGGGGGTGVTVSPVGFLVIDSKGKVDILNIEESAKDPVTKVVEFIENSPELIDKFKKLFSKNDESKTQE